MPSRHPFDQRCRQTLRTAETPDAVRRAVQLAVKSGMSPDAAWTVAAQEARVHDAALIREFWQHSMEGNTLLFTARWVRRPGAVAALVDIIERELLAPESDFGQAAALAVAQLRGRLSRELYPDVVARLEEGLRQEKPVHGQVGVRTLALAWALVGLPDPGPDLLEELDRYFRAASEPGGWLLVTTHMDADCGVWAAQLEHPDDSVLLLMGNEIERGPRREPRQDTRSWRDGAPHRFVECRCDIVRRAEEMAAARFPIALPPYCRRATGGRFRTLFVALAEAHVAAAADVLKRATVEQRAALGAADLLALLDSTDPSARLGALLLLHEVSPELAGSVLS